MASSLSTKEREEQIAAEAAENARREAEAKAARDAEEAATAAQVAIAAAEMARRQAEEQAAQSREASRVAAERAEADRIKGHQDNLQTMRRVAAPSAAPDPVAVIDAKLDRVEDVYNREWDEFLEEAERVHTEALTILANARVETSRILEEVEAKRRASEAQRAERAEQAAIDAERQRVAREEAAKQTAEAARAANIAHQRKINSEVLADILALIGDREGAGELTRLIITGISRRQVRHTRIDY